jgi:predicted metal-dependent hydrolase
LTITHDALTIQGLTIPLRIRKGKRRRVMMTFSGNALQVETVSGDLSQVEMDFLRQNTSWILRNYKRQSSSWLQKLNFVENITTHTMIFGRMVPVVFVIGQGYTYHFKDQVLTIQTPNPVDDVRKKKLIASVLYKIAGVYLARTMQHWCQLTGLSIKDLKVKNHRSKWGSCSSLKNINLNWHLVMVDKTLAEYVVIHELMHLKEMNHSRAFWALVAGYYPEYKQARVRLGELQWIIGIYE